MSGLFARIGVTRADSFNVEIELAIEPGRTLALLGPNGAGKTTSVSALAGLLPLDRGRIILNDRVLDEPGAGVFVVPEERSIGIVFQDYLLFPKMSVLDNIAFGLRSRGMGRSDARHRARSWADLLDLDAPGDRRPAELSGGQAQRVALARALVTDPDLLLLDEPLAALDVTTRASLRQSLGEYLDRFSGPKLLITHDPTEAFLLADAICIIEKGVITQQGSADDIRLRPKTPYAADLAGSNLLHGTATDGVVDIAGHPIHIADHGVNGPVLVTIHPHSISVHASRPEGSPRNAWQTRVNRVEQLGERVRFVTGPPLSLTVEVTKAAASELHVIPGTAIWLAIKATEPGVESA